MGTDRAMSSLVVDPKTLQALQLALRSTVARVHGEHRTSTDALTRTLATMDAAVATRQARVQQCERALEACQNSKRGDCRAEAAALAEARRRLSDALTARGIARQAATDFGSRSRACLKRLETVESEGQRYLSFKLDKVNAVNAGRAGGRGAASALGGLGVGSAASGGLGVHTVPGLPAGFVMVPVDLIDQTENPIGGAHDFGKGYSIEDLDYAFDLLESQVLPGLAGGATPSSFAAADQANGSHGTRSLSDTFSGFFGGDAIRLERRPDGTYAITNGRHRIFVASRFGRPSVPARIVGGQP